MLRNSTRITGLIDKGNDETPLISERYLKFRKKGIRNFRYLLERRSLSQANLPKSFRLYLQNLFIRRRLKRRL